MIQCKDCQYFQMDDSGKRIFKCDPFINIVEPECILKWQLLRLDMLASSHHAQVQWYQKIAPMQNKLFKFMEREIDEMDETEKWKYDEDQDDQDNPHDL